MVLGFRLGSLIHIGFDAVLVSAFLAGVRRSTGLTFKTKSVTDNDSFAKYIDNYLWLGETVMDQSVAFIGTSKYFERKR